jgi:hypothetical protein
VFCSTISSRRQVRRFLIMHGRMVRHLDICRPGDLAGHQRPVGRRDILAALQDGGDEATTPHLVSNALRQLGRVIRPRTPDCREADRLSGT